MAVWPGDTGFRRDVALSMAEGANLELSSITTTVHVGAHTDAPSHYVRDGAGIDERPLETYLGPCQVVLAEGQGRIAWEEMPELLAPRVLFRTGSFPDPDHFNTDFRSLSVELVEQLAARGVVLVGLDTPSVDPFHSKELEAHKAIARGDLAILEGVVLSHVEPGLYELIALPLKLAGADASPVRAVLTRS